MHLTRLILSDFVCLHQSDNVFNLANCVWHFIMCGHQMRQESVSIARWLSGYIRSLGHSEARFKYWSKILFNVYCILWTDKNTTNKCPKSEKRYVSFQQLNESPKNQGLIWNSWSVSHKIFSLAAILKNTVKLS